MSTAVSASPAPATGVLGYIRRVATSSLGAKIVMAVTGLLFLVWLVLHLAGNLAMFGGADKMNQYAALLADNPPILWGQRIGLFVVAGLHILSGLRLAALNRAARPEQYAYKRWRKATFASRTMAVTGVIVLVFLVFHLAHFTLHWVLGAQSHEVDAAGRHDVYKMVIYGFQMAPVALFYAFAVALVGLHLSHGFWSAFQSLGVNGRRWTPWASKTGLAIAIAIAVGFASIPLSVLFGVLR